MEGKGLRSRVGTTLLGVFIMSQLLVVAQSQLEAKLRCDTPDKLICYLACSLYLLSPTTDCFTNCGCVLVPDPSVSPLKNSEGATVNEFCKLGCASSVCNVAISTIKNSGEQVVMKEVIEQCNNACFEFCTKQDPNIALEIA